MTQYLSPLVSCLVCREVKSAKGLFTHILHSHDQQWKEEWRRLNGENLLIANLTQRKIIDGIIEAIHLVRAVGFEPTTRIFAPAPKAGGMNQTIRRSD